MTVRLAEDGVVRLEGRCPIEDAEQLQQRLLENPVAVVDWQDCTHAHAAVVQVILVGGPVVSGPAAWDFLNEFIAPATKRHRGRSGASPTGPSMQKVDGDRSRGPAKGG